jgi:hypothetical protein
MQYTTKEVSEQYTIAVEFLNKLPTATSLVSGTVSATDMTTNLTDNSVLSVTTAIISGTQAKVGVKAGTNGKRYKITFICTLNTGDVLEEDLMLLVANQ